MAGHGLVPGAFGVGWATGRLGGDWARRLDVVTGLPSKDLVAAPWGGEVCGPMPTVQDIQGSMGWFRGTLTEARGVDWFDPELHGEGWSKALDAGQIARAQAAADLLGSDPSHYLLLGVAEAVRSPVEPGELEVNACPLAYTPEALVRRVSRRFLLGGALRIDADGDISKEDDDLVNEMALIDEPVLLGLNDESNPYYRLIYGDDSFLAAKIELNTQQQQIPGSYAFPLNWDTATRLCTRAAADEVSVDDESWTTAVTLGGATTRLAIPDEQLEVLREVGEKLADADASVYEMLETAGRKLEILRMLTTTPPTRLGLVIAVEALRSLGDATTEDLGTDLARAAEPGILLNDSAARLLYALAHLNENLGDVLDGLKDGLRWLALIYPWAAVGLAALELKMKEDPSLFLLGLTPDEMEGLYVRMCSEEHLHDLLSGPESAWPDEVMETIARMRTPIVHLDPTLFEYHHKDDPDSSWADYVSGVILEYGPWLERADPTLQFVYTLELASVILEQTFNQESAFLALSGLAGAEGPLGSLARSALANADLSVLEQVLGGMPVARLIRYVWRQHMADTFLYQAEQAGYNLGCLYHLFCWMSTESSRDLHDQVMGGVGEQEVGPVSVIARGFVSGEGILGGLLRSDNLEKAWKALSGDDRDAVIELVELWDTRCIDRWSKDVEGAANNPYVPEADDGVIHDDLEAAEQWANEHISTVPDLVEWWSPADMFRWDWRDIVRVVPVTAASWRGP